jgi:hypothetical protein
MIKMQAASSVKPQGTKFIHEQGSFSSSVTTSIEGQLQMTTLPAKL